MASTKATPWKQNVGPDPEVEPFDLDMSKIDTITPFDLTNAQGKPQAGGCVNFKDKSRIFVKETPEQLSVKPPAAPAAAAPPAAPARSPAA